MKSVKARIGGIGVAVVLALGVPAAPTAQTRALVLEGGTLIDGTGRAPVADAVVVVTGNRITAVGPRGQVAVPPNANVIQLNGRTILPGLIDIHTHLQEWHLPMFLPYGVTTIGDFGNDTAWLLAQRQALKTGLIKGPRLYISSQRIIGPLGEGVDGYVVRTVPEARAYVRRIKAVGVDYLKVDETLTDELLKTVVDEGNAVGLRVVGHTRNMKQAAALGMKFDEHMYTMARALLEEEGKTEYQYKTAWDPGKPNPEAAMNPKLFPPAIDYMVKQQVYMNPTLVTQWSGNTERWRDQMKVVQQLVKDPNLTFVSARTKAGWLRAPNENRETLGGYANIAEFLKKFSEAGGKTVTGTDTGEIVIPGLSEHYEMQMLNDVGIPPMKVLQSATLWAAESIGQQKDVGSIEPGKLADFTIIEGNPLTDISVTKNVRMVIKEGQVMDPSYDPAWVNPIVFCAVCHKGWNGESELLRPSVYEIRRRAVPLKGPGGDVTGSLHEK
jgi:imidazolonepropionase-like amidohydrolase